MQPFVDLTSRAVALARKDVDTDQIIPAAYLKGTSRQGLAKGLFANWRFDENGNELSDFAVAEATRTGARILLTGDNFGCGSSREHAVWALLDQGFKVVISTKFADIFKSNAGRNGLVTAEVSAADHKALAAALAADPAIGITVDLSARSIHTADGYTCPFAIDSFARLCLLEGLDPLSFLLTHRPAIEAYERRRGSAGEMEDER